MAKTNKGLVAYAQAQLGKPYWYGTFGQAGTQSLYDYKKKQYPGHYTADRTNKYQKQIAQKVKVHDCIGLIKGYLWCDDVNDMSPTYVSSQDKGANGMYNICKERGPISTIPEIEGVLVFFDGHVGVYIGGGYVIEARGFNYGVVKTRLKDRPWKNWGKCPYIKYEVETKPSTSKPTATKSIEKIAQEVLDGKWGNGTDRVNRLTKAGYDAKKVQAKVNEILEANKKKTYAGGFPNIRVTYYVKNEDGEKVKKYRYYLKKGDKGTAIKYLQKFLNWYGGYNLKVDGEFGPKTLSAVKDFQKENGLVVDGKFGKKSLAKAKTIKK